MIEINEEKKEYIHKKKVIITIDRVSELPHDQSLKFLGN